MIYVTGDTHGQFGRIKQFCERFQTGKEDILIIMGDAGLNTQDKDKDQQRKKYVEELPITLFCIHGNHEQRPQTIESYKEKTWHGGVVYYEEEYPDLLFAKDGEIFDLEGKQTIVIGGAYSVDKPLRLAFDYPWWPDEQPSDEIKAYVEEQLTKQNWKVDVVLSHTSPLKYIPMEKFVTGFDPGKIDKSTEEWLDTIEDRLEYEKWYCGHYHTEKVIDQVEFLNENYKSLTVIDKN